MSDRRFIKLECPECGLRKRAHRADHDPPDAVLLSVRCPACSVGYKEDGGTYYDRRGEEVCQRTYEKEAP